MTYNPQSSDLALLSPLQSLLTRPLPGNRNANTLRDPVRCPDHIYDTSIDMAGPSCLTSWSAAGLPRLAHARGVDGPSAAPKVIAHSLYGRGRAPGSARLSTSIRRFANHSRPATPRYGRSWRRLDVSPRSMAALYAATSFLTTGSFRSRA